MNKDKAVVYFIDAPEFWLWRGETEVAGLFAVINHPKLGQCFDVRTSQVLNKFSDGSFETRNTMYVPATKEMYDKFAKDQEARYSRFIQDENFLG